MPERPPRSTRRGRPAWPLVVALGLALCGCHSLRFAVADTPPEHVVHHQKHFFAAGLFPRVKRVDVSEFCPHGVSEVREETTFQDAAVALVSGGLWTPRSSWYACLVRPGEDGWVDALPAPASEEPAP